MENDNKSAIESQVTVNGEAVEMNVQNLAGRDVYIEENNYYNNSLFTEVNHEQYTNEFYLAPKFTNSLLTRIKQNRLVLITGLFGFDKEIFARHLSSCLASLLKLKVKELRGSYESGQDIGKEIREESDPCLFILNQIGPKEVNFDLENIGRIAEQRQHFIIITSNLAIDLWGQPDYILKKYWFEIPSSDLYEDAVLLGVFLEELNKTKAMQPLKKANEDFTSENLITDKLTVKEVAGLFKTPEQIVVFCEMLAMNEEQLSPTAVDEILCTFKDQTESIITKWYKRLSEREKILALGAALFEGLYEGQFFDVIQKVIEEFWHYRNPDLKALDYGDLDFMMTFFKFEAHNDSANIFKGKFPNQRVDIIKAAWHTHRRHILAALPILVDIGSKSRIRKLMSKDIYSTREKRALLRVVIAELLSDLGMISLPFVEERLIYFAASSDESLQRVTAKALARWRLYGKEHLLFDLLQRWLEDKSAINKVVDILDDAENAPDIGARKNKAGTYLKSTILLTLHYAAEYDSPNKLNPDLIKLLCRIASENDTTLHTRLTKTLYPLIVKHHSLLRDELQNTFMVNKAMEDTIASAVSEAYQSNQNEVKVHIEYWLSNCINLSLEGKNKEILADRDQILVTVLKIYQRISYKEGLITVNDVWEVLLELFTKELRLQVRHAIIDTIVVHITNDMESGIRNLEKVFKYATLGERESVLNGLVEVYKNQRQFLSGADYSVNVGGIWYPSFINKIRPLTAMERSVYDWLNGEVNFANELALLLLIQFSKGFDLNEQKATPERIGYSQINKSHEVEAEAKAMHLTRNTISPVTLDVPSLTLMNRIRVWWWLLFVNSTRREVYWNYLRVLMEHRYLFSEYHVRFVISKLDNREELNANELSGWMRKWFKYII